MIGIVWGALVCLVERDLKRLIAYSSVAHMGFVVLALAAGSEAGVQAALFANIAHGVISAMLFFLVGGLKQRWGSVDLAAARPALRETSPRLGFLLLLGLAASLGLPGLAGFWGEFFAVYAAWLPADDRPRGLFVTCAVVAAIGAALAAAYALRVARRVWVGDQPDPEAAAAPPTPVASSSPSSASSRRPSSSSVSCPGRCSRSPPTPCPDRRCGPVSTVDS